jgi:hypothetical protein
MVFSRSSPLLSKSPGKHIQTNRLQKNIQNINLYCDIANEHLERKVESDFVYLYCFILRVLFGFASLPSLRLHLFN